MTFLISRLAGAGALSVLLASCAIPLDSGSRSPSAPVTPNEIPAASPGDQAGLERWVMSFRPRALAAGIQPGTFDRSMAIARYNPDVIRLDRRQAEFVKPVW